MLRLLLGALLLAAPAAAQEAADLARWAAINKAVPPPAASAIAPPALATAQAFARETRQCVPSGVSIGDIRPATADPVAIGGVRDGQLKNMWTATGTLAGCPGREKLRFVVMRMPDAALRVLVVNEGESLASVAETQDAMREALAAARRAFAQAAPECTVDASTLSLGPTRVTARSADLGPDVYGVRFKGSWTEVWNFAACGRQVEVRVDFRADGEGGAFVNAPAAAVKGAKR